MTVVTDVTVVTVVKVGTVVTVVIVVTVVTVVRDKIMSIFFPLYIVTKLKNSNWGKI